MKTYRLQELAELLGAELRGAADCQINGMGTLQHARPDQLAFLANASYRKQLADTKAGAVLLKAEDAEGYTGNCLVVADPYLAYARLSHQFDRKPVAQNGIHPSAVIASTAQIAATACMGPGVVVEDEAVIGERVVLGAHTFVGARSSIGADGWLAPRVSLYHDVHIGERVIIQSGAVLGGEGFGFAKQDGEWLKIAQIGGVRVGNDVEIGANTTVDRGALDDTKIGNDVKLDNQIMIAHNVEVGDHTAMAACVGISGSTKIGRNCMLAGGVGLVGHIEICDNVFITGMTMVTHSITEPGAYSSGTAMQSAGEWKKNAVRFRQLDTMAKRIRALEKMTESD